MYQVPRQYKPHLYGNYKIKWISCHQLENFKATAMFNEVLHEARFTHENSRMKIHPVSFLITKDLPLPSNFDPPTEESVLACNYLHSTHVKTNSLYLPVDRLEHG